MIDFSDLKTISLPDRKRLENSFFHTETTKDRKPENKKLKLIVFSSVAFLAVVSLVFFAKYNIVILPQHNIKAKKETTNLLSKDNLNSLTFNDSKTEVSLKQKIINLNLESGNPQSFTINLNKEIDISNSQIIVAIKNPGSKLKLQTIVRDYNFFSNASSPIITTLQPALKSPYIETSITLKNDTTQNLNLFRIKQIRFIFTQNEKDYLPVLIKNIFIKTST